jgi:putative nucleotidyltransferase with HDIG domain
MHPLELRKQYLRHVNIILTTLVGVISFCLLYRLSFFNYLLFHSLAELFSIVVACAVFLLAWNARQFIENDFLLFVSVGSLFVAGFDTVHMLSYGGMNIFPGYDSNLPTQLWVAGRYIQSVSFLLAPLFFYRSLNPKLAFWGFALISFFLLVLIFRWDIFPDCYLEGIGLTRFKIVSEYLVCLILLLSVIVTFYSRQHFNQVIFRYYILTIMSLIGAELAFVSYRNICGPANFIGHLLKTVSFIALYQAIIVSGLKNPFNLLFRDLKQSEEKLIKAHKELELRVMKRTVELGQANQNLTQAYNETIQGWSLALELRDKGTNGHTLRVTEMSLRLARKIGMDEEEILHIHRGALLHDIGKMGISDAILLKSGSLSGSEREIMKEHTVHAYKMLSQIEYLKPALDIPYFHHEKWDGTGYPLGLKGKDIPIAARLFAVVDVWDALRSDRPYSQAWEEKEVYEYIKSLAGSHFDPMIVEQFLSIIVENENKFTA